MGLQNSLVKSEEKNLQMQSATTLAMVESEVAKIQGKILMAKQFPRSMMDVERRIQQSCERSSLAKVAEYEYAKGGTKITGASIKLLEAIAQAYGNITYSWKELGRTTEKTKVVAYAWDLETNTSSELEFEVALYRDKKGGNEKVVGEREIYELIASNAQRRVRKCLESVIPRDLVDQAREWCNETLSSNINFQDGIDKAIEYFGNEYKIDIEQIEEYFGFKRQGFNKNTYLKLQKLFTSFKEGVADPHEVFAPKKSTLKNTLAEKQKGGLLDE